MGITSETAARWYRAQYHTEEFAEDFYLPWDHFANSGISIVSNIYQSSFVSAEMIKNTIKMVIFCFIEYIDELFHVYGL